MMTNAPRGVAASLLLAALFTVGLVQLQDVDAAEGPRVAVGDASGLERDDVTGSVFVPVYLSSPAPAPVVVSYYSVDGTAVAGSDYTRWGSPSSPRQITIPAGAVQTTINVPITPDSLIEADEDLTIVVQSVTGADATVDDETGVATIIDSDALSGPNPVITVSSGTVTEGDSGERRAQFRVQLSRAPASNVTVGYTTGDASAVAGTDYTAKVPGSVVFAPGQISKTIDVLVAADAQAGEDRTFDLNVTVIGGSPVEEIQMTGVATIVDDDADTTTTTSTPAAPEISTFALAGTPGPVPAVVPLRWVISNPSGTELLCRIDSTDDGTFEMVVPNCPAVGSRNVTITTVGTSTARLRVETAPTAYDESTRWITTSADPTEQFDITLRGLESLDPEQSEAFSAAAERVEQVIIRGVGDMSPVPARPACLPSTSPDLPSSIDDLIIDVAIQPIDGVGSVLGQAGPTCLRAGSNIPLSGQMIFDSADVAEQLTAGTFDTVVLHELGHVLGFGTIWHLTGSTTGTGGADPRYTGGRGTAEWSSLGQAANAPLENVGAAGTRDSHWRESTFGAELMTGYLNQGDNPFSRISVAAFGDLGYQIDLGQADPYTLPAPLAGLRRADDATRQLVVQRPTPIPLQP